MTFSAIRHLLSRVRTISAPSTSSLPVNLRELDVSSAAIAADVQYAIRIGQEYAELVRSVGGELAGRSILELGPGINFGSALVLACHCASLWVADRFLAPWQDPYHSTFYRELHAWLSQNHRTLDLAPLERILSANEYPPTDPVQVRAPAEALAGIPDAGLDIVVSNAVLEHVLEPRLVAAELFRITKPGGLGIHQVDFRDHRDFGHPLEYLLLEEAPFRTMFSNSHGECGGQTRHDELIQHFTGNGFELVRFEANMFAESDYLEQLMPRRIRATGTHLAKCWR